MYQQANSTVGNPDDLMQTISEEIDLARRSLAEVKLMLEQSQAELSKLTQRNTAITGHLQQNQDNFDTIPREDIRMTYDAALDAQQRLLVMRGQLEKLQNDQNHLQNLISLGERSLQLFSDKPSLKSGKGEKGSKSILEMLIDAQEAERQRLSRQMHDGPAQTLSNFIVQVEIAARLFDIDPVRAKDELNNLKAAAMSTFQKVRDFIFVLRPMMLDDLGMIPTIRRYVDAYKEQVGVEIFVTITGLERRFDPYIEVLIFRAIQELLGVAVGNNNEPGVKLVVKILLVLEDNHIRVSVSDNGKGYDPESIPETTIIGLKLIRDRVEMLGGFMEIDAAVGQGSKISFQLPVSDT